MRLFSPLTAAAFGAAFLASMAVAKAQETLDWHVNVNQIAGQSCVEDPNNKDLKCASLNGKDETNTFTKVSDLTFANRGGSDVYIQFCAKVEDKNFNTLECEALVDGDSAVPGKQKPSESTTNPIYVFCLSWFGMTVAGGDGVSDVQIECLGEAGMDGEVLINDYTTAVFSR